MGQKLMRIHTRADRIIEWIERYCLFPNGPDNAARESNAAGRNLLRQMLAAGLSRYEPDPLAALRKAKRKLSASHKR